MSKLLNEENPEVIVLIATRRADQTKYYPFTWKVDLAISLNEQFRQRYRRFAIFTHKDFPMDGYYLWVFVRNDVRDEAPPVTPPKPRASGGWD